MWQSRKRIESEEIEMFWFFRIQLHQAEAYDSAYHSDFQFSLGHKLAYDND